MNSDKHTNSEFFLDVGDGNKLYIQDWGNQKSKAPIIFLHGGPGAGCDDGHKNYFDGYKQRVIFFDQRGAGRSTPKGQLDKNTTADLVSDIVKILHELDIEKVIIYGRSWGSCLALNFAIRYPQYIKALVVGGVFLGNKADIEYGDTGQYQSHFPEVWQYFVDETPGQYQNNPTAYHDARILGDKPDEAHGSALLMSTVIGATMKLDDRARAIDPEDFDINPLRIERHYINNNCFIPENYIIKNAHKILAPAWIIQGRYDMICPPMSAWQLHQALPNSHYISTIAGHGGSDRGNFDAIQSIVTTLTSNLDDEN